MTVQAVNRGAIRELELPRREAALHDLHRMGYPFDSVEESLGARYAGSALQAEADLRLDAGVQQSAQSHRRAMILRQRERTVVHSAPDRLLAHVERPSGARS